MLVSCRLISTALFEESDDAVSSLLPRFPRSLERRFEASLLPPLSKLLPPSPRSLLLPLLRLRRLSPLSPFTFRSLLLRLSRAGFRRFLESLLLLSVCRAGEGDLESLLCFLDVRRDSPLSRRGWDFRRSLGESVVLCNEEGIVFSHVQNIATATQCL